jgi:16S rRNA processing protein RimM
VIQTKEREWLAVGVVRKPHGVHGDVLVDVLTDFPERLAEGVRFGLGEQTGPEAFYETFRVRYHKGEWLLAVKGVKERCLVESWRGRYLFLPEQTLEELPEGYYYEHHIVGLHCLSPEGQPLGEVLGLDGSGGQTRIVVRRGDRDFLVPWVPAIVKGVDIEARVVTLDPPPGLLDDDAVFA